jgi:hypothetical protein
MTIEARIGMLEAELRRTKKLNRWCVVLWLLTVGGAVAGFSQQPGVKPGPITATELRIVDDAGKPRAGLTVTEDGPTLVMLDENGKPRAGLSVVKSGPGLSMLDENGKRRATLIVNEDGPALAMFDENNKVRATLEVDMNGARLQIADKNGTSRSQVGSSATVSPSGKRTIYPESTLMLFGPDGNVIWTTPTR